MATCLEYNTNNLQKAHRRQHGQPFTFTEAFCACDNMSLCHHDLSPIKLKTVSQMVTNSFLH